MGAAATATYNAKPPAREQQAQEPPLGVTGDEDFTPLPLFSLTFLAPPRERVMYTMLFTGCGITVAIATCVGAGLTWRRGWPQQRTCPGAAQFPQSARLSNTLRSLG